MKRLLRAYLIFHGASAIAVSVIFASHERQAQPETTDQPATLARLWYGLLMGVGLLLIALGFKRS